MFGYIIWNRTDDKVVRVYKNGNMRFLRNESAATVFKNYYEAEELIKFFKLGPKFQIVRVA